MRSRATYVCILLVSLCASISRAQTTGRWIVIDSTHHGRFNSSPLDVAAASRGHYVVITHEDVVTGPYTIRRTTDAGTTWTVIRSDSGAYWRLKAVAHPTNSLIIAIGDTATSDDGADPSLTRHPFILRSSDAGSTWTRTNIADGMNIESIAMANGSSGIVVASRELALGGFHHLVLFTLDGGRTWTPKQIPNAFQWMQLSAARDHGSFVVTGFDPNLGTSTLFLTSDHGQSWESTQFNRGIRSIAFADAQVGIAVGGLPAGFRDTELDIVLRTVSGGRAWETVFFRMHEYPYGLWDVDFADYNNAIAVGGYGKILRTRDRGTTWSQDWPPAYVTAQFAGLNSVAYPEVGEALATTGGSSYVLRYTGQQMMAAPRFTAPTKNLSEIPLDVDLKWSEIDGARWYDLQAGDTMVGTQGTFRIFDAPYLDERNLSTNTFTVHLEPKTIYHFRVRARSLSDTSDWSNVLIATTRDANQTIVAPLFTRPAMNDSVGVPTLLEWTSVPGASSYDVTVFNDVGDIAVNLPGYRDTAYMALETIPGQTYFARVRSRNANEISMWSSVDQGTLRFHTVARAGIASRSEKSVREVMVSPNPIVDATATIVVESLNQTDARIWIEGLDGRRLRSVEAIAVHIGRNRFALDLEGLPAGMLLLVIDDGVSRSAIPMFNVH